VLECFNADEHAFEYVDYLYFELWVWDLLVNGDEDVESVSLVLNVADTVELRCEDSN
jgi:hypothetical protein